MTGLRYYWYAHPFWRAIAIIAALAIIGLLVWLLLIRDDNAAPTVVAGGGPVILTADQLAAFSTDISEPIYWSGPTSGTRLEVSETSSQLIFLRYLTGTVPVGDPSTGFLTVGTYPVTNGYTALRGWARHQNAVTHNVAGGGIAVSVPGSPTSVFFAEPARQVQVEVYDPQPGQALRMVMSGAVRPIAPGVQAISATGSAIPGSTGTPGATVAPSSSGTVVPATPSGTGTVVPSG
jgi:hypothetical protein